ncbi:MAG TPA: radical SAM protein, partial [bacterium]
MNHTSTLKPLDSVLIKPAGPDCNMSCKYCFYLTKRDLFTAPGPHRMTESILRETVRQVMEQGGERVGFGWQGGEPTLTGMDFYEKAVEFQHQYARPGQHAENGFQTNGVLID